MRVYGIPNCDTVKRARAWLADQKLEYTFHDFKKSGVPLDRLEVWCKVVGWESLLNRQGQTWRKLSDSVKQSIHDETSARNLMVGQPSVIKRPVIEWPSSGKNPGQITVGFSVSAAPFLDHSLESPTP